MRIQIPFESTHFQLTFAVYRLMMKFSLYRSFDREFISSLYSIVSWNYSDVWSDSFAEQTIPSYFCWLKINSFGLCWRYFHVIAKKLLLQEKFFVLLEISDAQFTQKTSKSFCKRETTESEKWFCHICGDFDNSFKFCCWYILANSEFLWGFSIGLSSSGLLVS